MRERAFKKKQKEILSAFEEDYSRLPAFIESIQAMAEGGMDNISLDNLLTGQRLTGEIPGVTNDYQTYQGQVAETYRKYNNEGDFGNVQVRSIVDMRTSFIANEGINIVCENENNAKWLSKFVRENKLDGSFLYNSVKSTEMAGRTLLYLKPITMSKKLAIKVFRCGYNATSYKYEVKEGSVKIEIKKKDTLDVKKETINSFFYNVITGGDDLLSDGATTKIGLVLNACENYDRAIKDMRRLNHVLARITPVIKTDSEQKAATIRKIINKLRWKIGSAFISSAEFKYEVPSTGAHDNLKSELVANIKDIQAVTGIPVHWLGYTDLMSNRSTAESLYETIRMATVYERRIWSEAMRDLLVDAQQLYIDNGGNEISEVAFNIKVDIPIIDYANFLEKVRGWSIAYNDGAISMDDYMNNIPGINPLETKRAIAEKEEEEKKDMKSKVDIDTNEDEGEENG